MLSEGQSVSRLWIVDRVMRIGGTQIKLGGVSSVKTDKSHQGQGLAARTMEAALEHMVKQGYEASILHGIPDFYHRFRCAPCMPDYNVRIATVNAERAPGPLR